LSTTHLSHTEPAYGSTCRVGCCVQGTDKRYHLYHSINEARVDEIDETRGTYEGRGRRQITTKLSNIPPYDEATKSSHDNRRRNHGDPGCDVARKRSSIVTTMDAR